jgi:hypothetical protein
VYKIINLRIQGKRGLRTDGIEQKIILKLALNIRCVNVCVCVCVCGEY